MFNSLFKKVSTRNLNRFSLTILKHEHTKAALVEKPHLQLLDTKNLPSDDFVDDVNVKLEEKSALDKCEEDVSHVAPYLRPTFNFAAYVNKSETLQELLKLDVNLYKLEKQRDVPEYILGLNFENDIKNHVIFLSELGLNVNQIGEVITRNPFIFKESLDDLVVRANYLKYKRFKDEMITRVLANNAFWLMYSTQDIDNKLGFFQKQFKLSGNEVRLLATKQPKLITYSFKHIKLNTFCVQEEMGFEAAEVKAILLEKPKVFMKNKDKLLETFDYVHNVVKIPLETIAKLPEVLCCRVSRLKQRHLFLEKLGKLQFNPKLPNYISILSIVKGTDAEFCTDIAKSSVQTYNMFLKSL